MCKFLFKADVGGEVTIKKSMNWICLTSHYSFRELNWCAAAWKEATQKKEKGWAKLLQFLLELKHTFGARLPPNFTLCFSFSKLKLKLLMGIKARDLLHIVGIQAFSSWRRGVFWLVECQTILCSILCVDALIASTPISHQPQLVLWKKLPRVLFVPGLHWYVLLPANSHCLNLWIWHSRRLLPSPTHTLLLPN